MPKGAPGIPKSKEHRRNISLALSGKKKTAAHKEAMKGPKTDLHCKAIKEAALRPETQNKRRETMKECYGVEHALQNPEMNHLRLEYWIKRGYSSDEAIARISEHQTYASLQVDPNNRKSIWQKSYWMEKGLSEKEAIEEVSRIQTKNAQKSTVTVSKICTEFLDNLEKLIGKTILREQGVINDIFVVDGLIDNKIVIEYFGDFWHMNPSLFESTDIHRVTGWKAESKWREDAGRIKFMKKNGYTVFRVWESDADTQLKIISEKIKEI